MQPRTYYVPKTADGEDIPAQRARHGTPSYGYASLKRALRYTPVGGYVEIRYQTASDDWDGGVAAVK